MSSAAWFARCLGGWILVLLVMPPGAAAPPPAAREAAERGDFGRAAVVLESRLSERPDDLESRFLLARVLARSGDHEAALREYDTLLGVAPDNTEYLLGRGQVLLWRGDPMKALLPLSRARALAPGHEGVWRAELQAREAVLGAPLAVDQPFRTEAQRRFPDAEWLSVPAPRRYEAGMRVRHDHLDGAHDDWHSVLLDVASRRPGASTWHASLESARRFGVRDDTGRAGLSLALPGGWRTGAAFSVTPGADFRPVWSGEGWLEHAYRAGVVVALKARHSAYPNAHSTRVALPLAWHAGRWRMTYTPAVSRLDGRETATSHQVGVRWRFSDRDYVGVRLGTGREFENLPDGRVLNSRMRSAVAFGQHWITARTGIVWDIGYQRRDALYERRSVSLGLRYGF